MEAILKQLLVVDQKDVNGLIKEFTHSTVTSQVSGNPVRFHLVRLNQDGTPRIRNLMAKLVDLIIAYCLPRERRETFSLKNSRLLFKEARDTFTKPRNQATSGEFGEMMIYFLLEGILGAPQIVSKMALKTSGNMNVNGSDGIHLGTNQGSLIFFFGESKVYQDLKAGVESAIRSAVDFNKGAINEHRTQHDFELNLVRNNLDIPPGPLRQEVLELLDPYSEARDRYNHVNACFIGFNWDILRQKVDEKDHAWEQSLCSLATTILDLLGDKFADQAVSSLSWHFYFIPFEDVKKAREAFMEELMG